MTSSPNLPNRLDQCFGSRLGIALYLVVADGCGAYEFGQSTTPFEGGVGGCWGWALPVEGGGSAQIFLVFSPRKLG